MSVDPLQYEKEFWADVIFKNLNGLTRSEDASLKFYAMELEKQNATEQGFREFSWIASNIFIELWAKRKREGKNLNEKEIEKLIKQSLSNTWKEYNEQKN
ncbi:hypothetical protein HYX19_03300 [Candidatus Woesearchaeota archaeon]|nr:hypothetical protein [Candidatus Woesearchaeota archaeon]MBI2673260.1 hypothetical protein [Candidatus Woesearchaeota archaeon]